MRRSGLVSGLSALERTTVILAVFRDAHAQRLAGAQVVEAGRTKLSTSLDQVRLFELWKRRRRWGNAGRSDP